MMCLNIGDLPAFFRWSTICARSEPALRRRGWFRSRLRRRLAPARELERRLDLQHLASILIAGACAPIDQASLGVERGDPDVDRDRVTVTDGAGEAESILDRNSQDA